MSTSDAPAIDPRLARQRRRFNFRTSKAERKTRTVYPVTAKKAEEVQRIVSDTSMKAFVEVWDEKIERAIRNLGMADHLDDIKQQVYTFICRRDAKGRTGLQRYNPKKASLSAYVYWAANAMTLNYRAKLGRDRLQLTYSSREDPYEGQASPESDERTEFWLQLERIAAELDDLVKTDAGSFFNGTGELVTRCPRTVLKLLMDGVALQDLPRALRCDKETVEALLGVLQSHPDLQDLLARFETGDL